MDYSNISKVNTKNYFFIETDDSIIDNKFTINTCLKKIPGIIKEAQQQGKVLMGVMDALAEVEQALSAVTGTPLSLFRENSADIKALKQKISDLRGELETVSSEEEGKPWIAEAIVLVEKSLNDHVISDLKKDAMDNINIILNSKSSFFDDDDNVIDNSEINRNSQIKRYLTLASSCVTQGKEKGKPLYGVAHALSQVELALDEATGKIQSLFVNGDAFRQLLNQKDIGAEQIPTLNQKIRNIYRGLETLTDEKIKKLIGSQLDSIDQILKQESIDEMLVVDAQPATQPTVQSRCKLLSGILLSVAVVAVGFFASQYFNNLSY